MREIKNENKKSKLIFDMRIVRKLLKMNGEPKFCPYCGVSLADGCNCHKNMIIDVKKMRDTDNETIAVFANTDSFKKDFDVIMEEIKAKKEIEEPVAEFQD